MAIDVGDAVLTFLGDTTNLDKAYAKVNQGSKSAVQPAAQDVTDLQNRIKSLEAEVQELAVKLESAGKRGKVGMHEATAEVGLLGEATGVQLPRHVRSFLAEMPGVSKALTAAFSTTAIGFLTDALFQGAEKLSEFIADTFIYTDAAKEEEKRNLELNKSFLEHAKILKELREEYALIGQTGPRKTALEIQQLNESLELAKTQLAGNGQQAKSAAQQFSTFDSVVSSLANSGIPGLSDAANYFATKAADGVNRTVQGIKNSGAEIQTLVTQIQQQIKDKQRELDQEVLKEQFSQNEKVIDLDRQTALSRANLANQEARKRLADEGELNAQGGALELSYQQKLEQIDLQSLQRRRTNLLSELQKQKSLGFDTTETLAALKAANAKIEQEENNHKAKVLKINTDLSNAIASLPPISISTVKGFDALAIGTDKLQTSAEKLKNSLYQVGTAFEIIGVESQGKLKEQVDADSAAVNVLTEAYKKNLISAHQLDLAKLKLIQDEIKLAQAEGRSTAQMRATEGEIKSRVTPTLRANATAWLQLAATTGAASGSIGQFAQAMAQAIVGAIASYAITKGVEQLALGWAALSPTSPDFGHSGEHFTSSALWFTLAGASTAAGSFLTGGSPGSVTNPVSTTGGNTPSPAEQPQQQPVNVSGIQRFAGGALLSRQTLALVGDSRSGGNAREGILPLDDPNAMGAIADAIAERMGGSGQGVEIHLHGDLGQVVTKITKKINRAVNKGTTTLTASHSKYGKRIK